MTSGLVWAGLALAVVGDLSYIVLMFLRPSFIYRLWLFDSVVVLGVVLAGLGWLAGGSGWVAMAAGLVALSWFIISRRELTIRGSDRIRLHRGDEMPSFVLRRTDGSAITLQDVIAEGPALITFYRGWWCPTNKAQLEELVDAYDELAAAGLSIYAASVDGPVESEPIQQRVGDKVTILCNVPLALLERVGIRDTRGAPWYDRMLFGAKQRDISMPAAVVLNEAGQVAYARRSERIDKRPRPDQILAAI